MPHHVLRLTRHAGKNSATSSRRTAKSTGPACSGEEDKATAVTAFWYAPAFIQAFDKEIDFLADDIAIALTTNSYTPNQDTHDYLDDIGTTTNQVATANGYTRELGAGEGFTLQTPVNTNTLNVVKFDAVDPVWTATGAGFTARRSVIADVTPGTAATDPLMCWMDFGQDETASGGGTFTVAFASGGIATITPTDATGFP